jgi:hypothetical protein
VANSGFTGVQISTNGPVDQASGHALIPAGIHPGDAGGHLTMFTYPGTAEGAANSQTNALQIGFDSSLDFRVWSRLTQPFAGTTPAVGQVGGIFFGPDQDNYARLAIVGTAGGGEALQFAIEVGGAFVEKARVDLSGTAISNLDVFLVGTPGSQAVTAYYDVNTTGAMTPLGTPVVVPASWFGNNAGSGANRSLAGLMGSNGVAPQMAFVYDFFRIDRTVPTSSNFPPAAPSSPAPAAGAANVATNTTLTWAAAANATSYDIAFGTAPTPPIVSSGQTSTTYQPPSALANGTTYFWQVTAKNASGATSGPVWSFTTVASGTTQPPSAPTGPNPGNGATGVATSTGLAWSASTNATSYDVAFGTASPPPVVATGQASTTYQPAAALLASTTYFWSITAKGAGGSTTGPVWSFATAAGQTTPTNIVIYASDIAATNLHGAWSIAADATSPNGKKLSTTDNGFITANQPLASPTHYVDVTFNATSGVPYRVWLRMKALNNSITNDSLWLQFSDALASGSPVYPLNSTSGLLVNLATNGSGKSLNGWGWQNAAYWLTQATTLTFAASGPHTLRIQVREDGVQLDQIVLSPSTYLNSPPGPATNDSTIIPKPQ